MLSDNFVYVCSSASLILKPPLTPCETFTDYVVSIPAWEHNLLSNVILHDGVFSIVSQWCHTTPSTPLLIATDGSAPHHNGSFGWVISLANGKRLAANYGRVQGAYISSFRAESYGLLSALCFVQRVSSFTSTNLPTLSFYLDSKSVISRVSQLLQWDTLFPNQLSPPNSTSCKPLFVT